MGTLTADVPRLAHYCEHKLPTSCRLSSIGECCACYDRRHHAASYQKYIDGVGFVPRGTRWQDYCSPCKEFWQNRVEASGLRPGQTRIPECPDQTEFLQRWYEFHQRYRIVRKDDGSEERIAVLGEDFRDVSPGVLPRTLEELRAGRARSELEEREREANRQLQETIEVPIQASGPNLDETLDGLFQAAATEDSQESVPTVRPADRSQSSTETVSAVSPSNVHAQSMAPARSQNREYQARRIAALRRELHRMRSGIERVITGLRDLGEDVPDHREASQRLTTLGNTLDSISPPSREEADQAISTVNALTSSTDSNNQGDRTLARIQVRVDEARRQYEEARRNRDQAQSELDVAEQEVQSSQSRLRQLQNQRRTTENYIRLFGTREEMIAQGENYESPIGGLFTRAWERFRVAEEARREEDTLRQVLEDEERIASEGVMERLAALEARDRDVWGVPQSQEASARSLRNNVDARTLSESASAGTTQEGMTRLNEPRATPGARQESDNSGPMNVDHLSSNELRDQSRRLTSALNTARSQLFTAEVDMVGDSRIFGGPPGERLDEDPYTNNDRGLDALYVFSALLGNEAMQSAARLLPLPDINQRVIEALLRSVNDNSLTGADRELLDAILTADTIVWGICLPAERNRRRRQRGEHVTFTPDAHGLAAAGHAVMHDIEIMAECFQMSSEMRNRSVLSPPAKLAMLYRLQRGERSSDDRAILCNMLEDDATVSRAREIHEESYGQSNAEESVRRQELESHRRQAARQGDHSRSELDSQRRATHTAALAASRAAMVAGPAALLQRMAERDEETRAAYQRLQENGFAPPDTMTSRRLRDTFFRPINLDDFTASPSASDEGESDGEGRGLDAKDSGRPDEPLTEEEMTVVLDCRICYSQKAEICTLPCGHLTMCRWCSDQHSPTLQHDRTRPRRAANCPVCRKAIKQKVKVIRA